jgi:TonB family protein
MNAPPKKKSHKRLGQEKAEVLFSVRSLGFAVAATLLLFGLLPLSEYVRGDEWMVREVDWVDIPKPPPKKPVIEQRLEGKTRKAMKTLELSPPKQVLNLEQLETSLEVGPGDFRAVFAMRDFNLAPGDVGGEFVFKLHELDRIPNVLKRGRLRYPGHLLRRGLEGKVKLLVLIDERGVVKVQEVISSSHPDFVESSIRAAEESTYEPPLRNGKNVKVQFFLPLEFKLSEE